jgi:hypothetical protein
MPDRSYRFVGVIPTKAVTYVTPSSFGRRLTRALCPAPLANHPSWRCVLVIGSSLRSSAIRCYSARSADSSSMISKGRRRRADTDWLSLDVDLLEQQCQCSILGRAYLVGKRAGESVRSCRPDVALLTKALVEVEAIHIGSSGQLSLDDAGALNMVAGVGFEFVHLHTHRIPRHTTKHNRRRITLTTPLPRQ